jgi:hypothetical protein
LFDSRWRPEPELLKADLDRLSHPALSRRRPFSPHALRFGAPASTIAGILDVEGASEPLQFKDQCCALRPPFLGPPPATEARKAVEMFGVFRWPHGQALSATATRRAALAVGVTAGVFEAPTRAKISLLGPNAMALPS